jgi:hypothetical protein
MPIKNVTNIYRPVRQGKIHLGIKVKHPTKKDSNRSSPTYGEPITYPKEVDFFVLKGCPELFEFYGPDPEPENPQGIHKELRISLPSAKFDRHFDGYLEKVFPQYLKQYKGKGGKGILVCRGDGEKATTVDEQEGGMKSIPCPCASFENGECKKIGIFRFRIREIPSLNIYQITTSSFNSLVNLNSFIRDLLEHCLVFNVDPSDVKLILRRSTQTVQRLEKGKPKSSTHHILELDLDPQYYKSLDDLRGIKALPHKDEHLLPPPDESKDELFYPRNGFEPKVEEAEAEESFALKREDEEEKDKKASLGYDSQDLMMAKNEMNELVREFKKKGGIVSKDEMEAFRKIKTFEAMSIELDTMRDRIEDLKGEHQKDVS